MTPEETLWRRWESLTTEERRNTNAYLFGVMTVRDPQVVIDAMNYAQSKYAELLGEDATR